MFYHMVMTSPISVKKQHLKIRRLVLHSFSYCSFFIALTKFKVTCCFSLSCLHKSGISAHIHLPLSKGTRINDGDARSTRMDKDHVGYLRHGKDWKWTNLKESGEVN